MPQNKIKRDAFLNGENPQPGFPGYRTRQDRSGLDPLDTNRETAFMEGTFYRKLFTLKLKTRNPIYLALMFISGIFASVFMSFALYWIITEPKYGAGNFVYYLGFIILCLLWGFFLSVGLALLANFVVNLRIILGFRKSPPVKAQKDRERPRRKLPKRRKDFR